MSKVQNALKQAEAERLLRAALEAGDPPGEGSSALAQAMWQEVRRWETLVARRSPQAPPEPGRPAPADTAVSASAVRPAARPAAGPERADWDAALRQAQAVLAACEQRLQAARHAAGASAAGVTAQEAVVAQAAQELARRQQASRAAQEQAQAAERVHEAQRQRVAALQQGHVLATALRQAEAEAELAAQQVARAGEELAHCQARQRALTTTVDDLLRRLAETVARINGDAAGPGPGAGQHPEGTRA
jgi:hypothetical protein